MSNFMGVGIFWIGLNRTDLGCWRLTLSKTTPSTGCGAQFFQLASLLPGNAYQLKELVAASS